VLFSQHRVADFVNRSFEPVWQSVRPVPIVRIDFGNGTVLTRTLHGNILTSVCTPNGLVVDALPGIYSADVYVDQLNRLRLLAQLVQARPEEGRDAWLRDYHRREARAKAVKPNPAMLRAVPITKGVIERPVEVVVRANVVNAAVNQAQRPSGPPVERAVPKEDVASWKTMAEDTRLNESLRRWQIHEMLASVGLVPPERVTRPIYKDVLHADLDDPYLGLGSALFDNYPFAREDQPH
jgi:hypothetical protein